MAEFHGFEFKDAVIILANPEFDSHNYDSCHALIMSYSFSEWLPIKYLNANLLNELHILKFDEGISKEFYKKLDEILYYDRIRYDPNELELLHFPNCVKEYISEKRPDLSVHLSIDSTQVFLEYDLPPIEIILEKSLNIPGFIRGYSQELFTPEFIIHTYHKHGYFPYDMNPDIATGIFISREHYINKHLVNYRYVTPEYFNGSADILHRTSPHILQNLARLGAMTSEIITEYIQDSRWEYNYYVPILRDYMSIDDWKWISYNGIETLHYLRNTTYIIELSQYMCVDKYLNKEILKLAKSQYRNNRKKSARFIQAVDPIE